MKPFLSAARFDRGGCEWGKASVGGMKGGLISTTRFVYISVRFQIEDKEIKGNNVPVSAK